MTARLHVRIWWGDYLAADYATDWPGYTADEALKNRLRRLRDAGANVTRDDRTLILTFDSPALDGTERREEITFEDVTT